ncbi:hypothetical protein ACFQLX_02305 [Streptomyces polyrhachis]|uniref:Integral membrane protein n=1 Tax=Streptomyces polyrhachis TaxID=1282885 RepID=A0ABW2GBS8_9ACTN
MTDSHPEPPGPRPLRFFGTTWAARTPAYWLRRLALAVATAAAAAAGAFILKLAYDGLTMENSGSLVTALMIAAFAICSSLAFTRTLAGFTRRPPAEETTQFSSSSRATNGIGFIGVLLAYFVRNLLEAPGERLHRQEWQDELSLYEKQRRTRSRNPAKNPAKNAAKRRTGR